MADASPETREFSAPDQGFPKDGKLMDAKSDLERTACPSEMKGVADFCIDEARGPLLVWTRAAEHCMAQGKRLCSVSEWEEACGETTGSMTGQWEWTSELKSATSAWKRGSSTCLSSSDHDVTSGPYATRCCLTLSPPTTGMVAVGTGADLWIDQGEGLQGSWMVAASNCMLRKLRLCGDSEWETACKTSVGLNDMTDGWEWVREMASDTSGQKRGSGSCATTGAHSVDGNYGVRCCGQTVSMQSD